MFLQRVLLLFLISLAPLGVADSEPQRSVGQLFVRGEAQLMVSPDQVSMVLGVTTEASSTKKAMADNTNKMNAMIHGLKILGLSERDYQTQNFRVEPVWSRRPRNADSQWRSKIIAYRIHNNLRITTQDIDLLGDIIEVSTVAGANQIHSINFSLSNPREYRERAIRQAMQNAKADAQALVEASGDTIKRILSLHLDNAVASVSRANTVQAKSLSLLESEASAEIAPPVDPGDITVIASVSVTYELVDED